MLRYDEATGNVGVFRSPAGYTNGHTVDRAGPAGQLRARQPPRHPHRARRHDHRARRRVRGQAPQQPQRRRRALRRRGLLHATPPTASTSWYEGHKAEREYGGCYVFRIDPITGALSVVADDFDRPNGLAFSLDERLLYVSDTGAPSNMRVLDVDDDGTLTNGREFAKCTDRRLRRLPARRGRPHLDERRRRRARL